MNMAHNAVSRQAVARRMYISKFQEAENGLRNRGRCLKRSFPDLLNSAASRIYACYDRIESTGDGDEDLVREMVRLAFGFDRDRTSQYLKSIEDRVRQANIMQRKA